MNERFLSDRTSNENKNVRYVRIKWVGPSIKPTFIFVLKLLRLKTSFQNPKLELKMSFWNGSKIRFLALRLFVALRSFTEI